MKYMYKFNKCNNNLINLNDVVLDFFLVINN